jgi:hypothetical protein
VVADEWNEEIERQAARQLVEQRRAGAFGASTASSAPHQLRARPSRMSAAACTTPASGGSFLQRSFQLGSVGDVAGRRDAYARRLERSDRGTAPLVRRAARCEHRCRAPSPPATRGAQSKPRTPPVTR